jgi:hypothetical protein
MLHDALLKLPPDLSRLRNYSIHSEIREGIDETSRRGTEQ